MSHAERDDGPLFRWRPPEAMVLPFPARARIGFVRRNAKTAAAYRRPEAVSRYFADRADDAYARLVKAGVDPAIAEADAAVLHDSLWREFHRITAGRGVGSGQPGGVA